MVCECLMGLTNRVDLMKKMNNDWITTSEACKISGYHGDHLRELIREGKIEGRKFATVWQVDRNSLLEYLDRMVAKGERRGPKKNERQSP